MGTSFAELNDRVYLELEIVSDFLSVDKIHNAVVQRHNIRVQQSRTSTGNVLLGVTASFTPTEKKHDITALIGKGVPVAIECLDEDGTTWLPLRVTNPNYLTDYTHLGVIAVAFSGEETASNTTEPTQYAEFSLLPGRPCRIKFDRDLVRKYLTDLMLLPDSVAELMIKEAQNSIIPRLKASIDVQSRNDKELRQIARDLKQSLTEIQQQNLLEIKQLEALWKIWAFKDRSSENSFNKPTPSGRSLYGNSYNPI